MDSTETNQAETLKNLAASIRDEKHRLQAWDRAADIGPAAIRPLSELLADPDFEVARAAKRGLWRVVRQAGRPDHPDQRREAVTQLLALLETEAPVEARREVLWMLSEIGGEEAVPRIAEFLKEEALREDTRMAIERIPGPAAIQALRKGLSEVPEKFKYHLAHSLRVRGVKIADYPSQKLAPTNPYHLSPKRS